MGLPQLTGREEAKAVTIFTNYSYKFQNRVRSGYRICERGGGGGGGGTIYYTLLEAEVRSTDQSARST